MTISATRKQQVITGIRRHDTDSGSPEVQVGVITERISELQEHFRTHPKDFSSRRGLLLMVGKRNRLLKYLAETDRDAYSNLIKKLGLRK